MADATLTRYELSLGSQNSVTGWYAKAWSSSSIDGSIQPRGAVVMGLPCGGVARYPHTLFTADVIHVGDEVKDANGTYYRVKSADQYWWLDQFSHYQCELEKRDGYTRVPTSSGTWHLDSDSLKTDPRYRHKLWLDTYLNNDNLELDDGDTNAAYRTCFSEADYPLTQVFLTKDVDALFSIDKRTAQQLTTDKFFGYQPYAFIETVPITCYTVDKSGLTATNLLEQMEQEIRHVCTDHPLGSIRSIESTEYKSTDIGGTRLWETTVTIKYKRANDDYGASYPRITWGTSGSPTGTYRFPNCVNIEFPETVPHIPHLPVGRVSHITQRLGDSNLIVKLTCDLDVDADYAWKRAQTGAATDVFATEVLWDIKHNGAIDEPYQTLTLGASGPAFNVTLQDYREYSSGGTRFLEVTFEEYTTSNQSGSTYTTRYGIS